MVEHTRQWSSESDQQESISRILVEDQKSSSLPPIRLTLFWLRFCHALPKEFRVGYTEQYGRYILPQELYEPCRRQACKSCQLRIPSRRRFSVTAGTIDRHFTLQLSTSDPRREYPECVELKYFYPKCVPNLPPDLVCPRCRMQNERTLYLTQSSYQSRSFDRSEMNLTPFSSSPSQFPSQYGPEISIPFLRPEPLEDQKFFVSIHCMYCNLIMLSPCAPCRHENYVCDSLGPGGARQLGGYYYFVRHVCSYCRRPAYCHECQRTRLHERRPLGDRQEGPFIFQNACPTCKLQLCVDHAWVTSCCHHI